MYKQICPNILVPDHKGSKDAGWDVNGAGSSQMYAWTYLQGKKNPIPLKIKAEQGREELTLYLLQEMQNNKAFTLLTYVIYLAELCLNMICVSAGEKKKIYIYI